MDIKDHLRSDICALAKRSVSWINACPNEESTKLYLVLPLIGLLGYDCSNPYEVCPEVAADFDSRHANKIDFAVMRDGHPMIAIECKKVGTNLAEARAQLRAYYSALRTAKLAILTNGIVFELFVDSNDRNVMDEDPFLTLDLEAVSIGGISEEVLDALVHITKPSFDPDCVVELAHTELMKKRLRSRFVIEANAPSEDFCRFFLQEVGLKNVRKAMIERRYASVIKTAFHEALVIPLAQRLDATARELGTPINTSSVDRRIVTTDRELAIVNYVRRRLAFLVSDETLFNAIEDVQFKDYIGKLAIYYHKERKGRLFDYIEGSGGFDKFIFPEPPGEIVTNNILEIDQPLLATFTSRVREIASNAARPLATIA